ncbi:unnamed protein product, partial [Adineta steineri]
MASNQINSVSGQPRNYHKASADRMIDFQKFARRYEISNDFAVKLRGLEGYEFVFICDDSGSMNTPLGDAIYSHENQPTRWDQLKKIVSIVVDLASALDPDGIDIYFLNRQPILNVRSSAELGNVFAMLPEGSTPIVPVLRQVLQEKHCQIHERKLLILLATDGVPTDEDERPDINTLKEVLMHERIPADRVPVTIVACTDDEYSMEYLNNWDKTIPNLDVVQDYRSEQKQILDCQGKDFPFSFGDYIVKILMGGVDSWFDDLDEKKVELKNNGRSNAATGESSKDRLNKAFAAKLRGLEGYEFVFICDDSSSMITPIGEITDPFASLPTRWEELKKIVSIVVDLASTLDPDGVDIYFLNREPIFNVRSSAELVNIFKIPPRGSTPIVPVLRRVLQDKHQQIYERKLLILLATDGVPTDNHERPDINTLKQVLRRERFPTDRVPVTIIACTDDEDSMEYLNNWDKIIPNLDVVQDYRSEQKQILDCQGKDFPFSFGDYIVKILMGGVDSWFDDLDEKKVELKNNGRSNAATG